MQSMWTRKKKLELSLIDCLLDVQTNNNAEAIKRYNFHTACANKKLNKRYLIPCWKSINSNVKLWCNLELCWLFSQVLSSQPFMFVNGKLMLTKSQRHRGSLITWRKLWNMPRAASAKTKSLNEGTVGWKVSPFVPSRERTVTKQ